jgi:hypothetical protein
VSYKTGEKELERERERVGQLTPRRGNKNTKKKKKKKKKSSSL